VPANTTVYTDANCKYEVSVSVTGDVIDEADNCTIELQATYADSMVSNECEGSKILTRTWSLVDNCGNQAPNQIQTITILDNIAPTFTTSVSSELSVSCDAIPPAATMEAIDNCGTSNVSFVENKIEGTCVSTYTLVRIWTATDFCGNSISTSQKIKVSDSMGPTITSDFEAVLNVNCDAIPPIPEIQFTDNCANLREIIRPSADVNINQTPNSYAIVREWKVSDLCGNSNTYTQTINVTIQNNIIPIASEACNGDNSIINLNDLIPTAYGNTAFGTWKDINSSGGLDENGNFSPFGIPIGEYILEYQNNDPDCPRKIQILMAINTDCIVLGCGNIIVHNAFSPNNDGINEVFIIENIDDIRCYPTNSLEIYNRWGVLIYETQGYDNNTKAFRGISEGRLTVNQSQELPTGTYFYILQYTTSEGRSIKESKYLYLSR
jgi:gliding motility-associated-like protein